MSHTPGPWHSDFPGRTPEKPLDWLAFEETEIYGGAPSAISEPVCNIPHNKITTEGVAEAIANYHLIVAAPDLLDALEGLVEVSEQHNAANWRDDYLDAARSAIALARGGGS